VEDGTRVSLADEGGVGDSLACPYRSPWVDVEVLSI